MSFLYFQLYNPCGLFNQITSLELAVGLSHTLDKQLVMYNINNPPDARYEGRRVPIYTANYWFNNREELFHNGIHPNISNLMNWKNKDNTVMIDDIVEKFTNEKVRIENLMEYYYSDVYESSENEKMFSENRKPIDIENNKSIHVKKTLGYYSRFFYNRSVDLDKSLSSVRFKQEYYDLANIIAKSLGEFQGAHIRLTDHRDRARTTQSDFENGISRLSGKGQIVLCTDEPNHEFVKSSDHKFILLDKYILDNFYKEFRSLTYREEVSFGILNNLVMHHSSDFIGTSGSTYTGYIYRNINQTKDIELKLFEEATYDLTGPYSWNGHYHDTVTKQWWREWKESRLKLH